MTRRLRDLGYAAEAEAEVSTAGRYIDIGIRDPERPGEYVIGIECDGAAYHSSRSARDRIRETQLRNLGWELHRIWSSDWLRDPPGELRKCVAAIEDAKRRRSAGGTSR